MRIGLFTPEPWGSGGIGSYTATTSRALAELGHQVEVLMPGASAREQEEGVLFTRFPVAAHDRLPAFNRYWGLTTARMPWAREVARMVRRRHAEQPFDVIEIPEWLGGALFLGEALTPPIVIRLHSHLELVRRLNRQGPSWDSRLAAYLEARALRRGRLLVANSHALADELARDYGYPRAFIEVLPLGVELARFSGQRDARLKERLELPPETVIALFVGRIERRKGVERLIEAFAVAAARLPYLHLVLAGRDTALPGGRSLREQLEARLRRWGLGGRVSWLGPVDPLRLPDLYAGSDFLVAPSPLEPFGLVYLEAMASGRPVIGGAAGGAPEIVTDGREGLLVADAVPELAGALLRLGGDEAMRLRMGRRAHERALAFDHREVAARTVECYRRARRRSP